MRARLALRGALALLLIFASIRLGWMLRRKPPKVEHGGDEAAERRRIELPRKRCRLTLCTNRVLFGSGQLVTLDDHPTGLRINPESIAALRGLTSLHEVYLITQTEEDGVEEAVKAALSESGVYAAGMDPRRTLFCSTTLGRASISRQLAPHVHVDDDVTSLLGLTRFVPVCIVLSGLAGSDLPPAPLIAFQTLADLLQALLPSGR